MRPIRTLALVLLLGGAPLCAQTLGGAAPGSRRLPPATPPPTGLTLKEVREAFAKADADHSGGLSVDESAFGGLDAAAFAAGDADGDSKLSIEEYTVASESRAAKLATGAATDLTAESTRLQALRRAQKSEELKTRREARGTTPVSGSEGVGAPAPSAATAPAGPAAARRALAPASEEKERSVEEIRASIVRRLRNGEISEEDARVALAAIDRRIANSGAEQAKPDASSAAPAAQVGGQTTSSSPGGSDKEPDLRAVEATLSRRLRNSELDPDKAKALYGDTIRRIENARGAGTPQPARPGETTSAAGEPRSSETGASAQGFRARIAEAQGNLTRRLRNAEVTPEQAAIEEALLAKRLRNAAEGLRTGAAPAESSVDGSMTPAAPGASTPAPAGSGSQSSPTPARQRTDGTEPAAPATPAANPPARRGGDGTPPAPVAPAPAPARGSTPPPAAQPSTPSARPAPKEKEGGETKPATPAPVPATRPARPASGGGS